MDIQPFTVQIPEADLVDLQTRLARTRWPDADDAIEPETIASALPQFAEAGRF